MKFSRPRVKYTPKSVLPNQTRYYDQTMLGQPVSAEEYDSNFNYLIDCLNYLLSAINEIVAGLIPGGGLEANKDKVCYTDGVGPKWKFITGVNCEAGFVTERELAKDSVSSDKIQTFAIVNRHYAPQSVTADKMFGSLSNEDDPAIVTVNPLDNTYSETKIGKYEIATNFGDDGVISSRTVSEIWNNSEDNLCNGSKISDGTINGSKISDGTISNKQLTPDTRFPTGSIISYGVALVGIPETQLIDTPPGWLECNGAKYLKTDYPLLFKAIGATFGATSTMFKVPNLKGRTIFGISLDWDGSKFVTDTGYNLDNILPEVEKVGVTFGAESVTLEKKNIPNHQHNFNVYLHAHNGNQLVWEWDQRNVPTQFWPRKGYGRPSADPTDGVIGASGQPFFTAPPGILMRYIIRAI